MRARISLEPRRYDFQGLLLLWLIFTTVLIMPPAILTILITQLDPFYYVFEEILPRPLYRSVGLTVGVWITRLILASICVYDFLRFLIIFLGVFMLFLSGIIRFLNELKSVRGTACLKYYLSLRITLCPTRQFIGRMVGGVVPWAHFGTVALLWMSIQCWNFISPYVACFGATLAILVVVITIVVLFPEVTKLGSVSERLIQRNLNFYYSRRYNRVDQRYYLYSSWKSQEAIAIPCGYCFTLGKGFIMQYSNVLVNNLVNAVLVFNPSTSL